MRSIDELMGIIKGINYDGVINEMEVSLLQTWLDKNRNLAYEARHGEIIKIIDSILEDNFIDEEEREQLLNLTEYSFEKINSSVRVYELLGIIEGIVCDGIVNQAEVNNLSNWIKEYGDDIKDDETGIKLYNTLAKILEDDVITKEEQKELLDILSDRIVDSQFETKLSYLCKQVKARKNIGIDLIDLLDNEEAMAEIHKRAVSNLKIALGSYSGTLKNAEVIFVSLCLIGMLEYDGSFYDSVRIVYSELYTRYSQQKIEGFIRSILDRYRTEEERNSNKGSKNAMINVVLSNAIVPSHFLGAFFEFIYDIYKLNFEYDLPADLNEEFKFVYDGLRSSMQSDDDTIQDNVTKKTYKLIKSTKQLITGGKYIESVIKLSIIVVKLIDKHIWNKGVKIYNPYLKVGFEKWLETIGDDLERSQRDKSEIRSRWEPKYMLDGNAIYLVPPVHKIKSHINYWDVFIQVLSDEKIIYEDNSPDIREIIAGYKIIPNRIKVDSPLNRITYRLMCGNRVIYDSGDKLHRHFIMFDKNGFEIYNNSDYKGTAILCSIGEYEKFDVFYKASKYILSSKSVRYGDSCIIGDVVFNFSALVRPGVFGEEYDNHYIIKRGSTKKIKIYKEVKYLVFECENTSKNIEVFINERIYKISDFTSTIMERQGVCKYMVDLSISEPGIYYLSVVQICDDKRNRIADFNFVLDAYFSFEYDKLDDTRFVYCLYNGLQGKRITEQIDISMYNDESIEFEYKGNTYYYLLPFELEAYRLSGTEWRPMSDEMWIGDINNETIFDIYDFEVEEFVVYSAIGQPLETVVLKDKGVYKQAAVGFLRSYKEEYDFVFLAFLKNGKVKRAMFCNNKCQMRDETEIIYDMIEGALRINPWFYGKGNVCCEIFDSNNISVFKRENLSNDDSFVVNDLESYEKYSIVFTEKSKGLGLALKKNREMKRFARTIFARKDFIGKELKITEVSYVTELEETKVCSLSKSYIRFFEMNDDGKFVAEIYKRDANTNFRSNLAKPLDVEICSDIINGHMELIISKRGKALTYDKTRNHVTDSTINIGEEVINYVVVVE